MTIKNSSGAEEGSQRSRSRSPRRHSTNISPPRSRDQLRDRSHDEKHQPLSYPKWEDIYTSFPKFDSKSPKLLREGEEKKGGIRGGEVDEDWASSPQSWTSFGFLDCQ